MLERGKLGHQIWKDFVHGKPGLNLWTAQSRMYRGVSTEHQSILWLDLSLWLLDQKRVAEMYLHLWLTVRSLAGRFAGSPPRGRHPHPPFEEAHP